jgi:hypothetical protein
MSSELYDLRLRADARDRIGCGYGNELLFAKPVCTTEV